LYGFFILPESLPKERRAKSAWHMANPLGSLTLLRSHPELAGLSAAMTLFYLAHNALPSVFVLYTEYRYGWNERDVGLSLTVVGVCAAAVSGGLVGPYVKRFGEKFSLLSGLVYGVLGFAGFALATRGYLLLASIPFIALWGVAGPAMQSRMSRRVDPTSQGKLQGAINSLRGLTGMIGPLIFTQVFAAAIAPQAAFHLPWAGRSSVHVPGAPYLVAAGLLSVSMAIAYAAMRRPSSAPPAVAVERPTGAAPPESFVDA
jgi:DHA1 family tetracycline resistance protein-like MFS transporter